MTPTSAAVKIEPLLDPKITTLDKLTEKEIVMLLDARLEKWGDILIREHKDAVFDNSLYVLNERKKNCGDIQFILYSGSENNKTIHGAIHPLIVDCKDISERLKTKNFKGSIFEDHNTLTGSGTYSTHNPNGNFAVCPEVYSRGIKGGGTRLIEKGVSWGLEQKAAGKVDIVGVYTRPFVNKFLEQYPASTPDDYVDWSKNMAAQKKVPDPFTLHHALGAEFKAFIPGARLKDVATRGFCAIMEYKQISVPDWLRH